MLGYSPPEWNTKETSSLGDLILHTSSPTDYTNKQPKEKTHRAAPKKKKDGGPGEKPYYCPITGCIRLDKPWLKITICYSIECKVYQLLEVCDRHINNWVAEGLELVNITVPHFQQLRNFIVQLHHVKNSPENRVNADLQNLFLAFST